MMDQFWGDRSGTFTDPHGYTWSIATHKEDLTPQEMKKRQDEFMKQFAIEGLSAAVLSAGLLFSWGPRGANFNGAPTPCKKLFQALFGRVATGRLSAPRSARIDT